jgi:hypothetical protein
MDYVKCQDLTPNLIRTAPKIKSFDTAGKPSGKQRSKAAGKREETK